MSRGEDFRSVGVECTVVNVEGEANHAIEGDVLGLRSDLGGREEECHCDQGADDHGVLSAQYFPITHITRQHWTLWIVNKIAILFEVATYWNSTDVDQCIVSPGVVG